MVKAEKMSTSINITKEAWLMFKSEVAKRGCTISEVLEGLIKLAIKDPSLLERAIEESKSWHI